MVQFANAVRVKAAESGHVSYLNLTSNVEILRHNVIKMVEESYKKNKDKILVLDTYQMYEDGVITHKEYKEIFNEGASKGLYCDYPNYPLKYTFFNTRIWSELIKEEYEILVDEERPTYQSTEMELSVE